MKLFLKPTAIFACAALLFCGCGDDDTEDLSFKLAPVTLNEPYAVSVASGEGRAEVTWRVPDDSNITHAMVQWDNATGGNEATLNEITRVPVIPGQRKTFSIGDIGAGELKAGEHNFYITNITVNGSDVITGRSNPVDVVKYIYDKSTYEGSRPNPYNIKTLRQSDVEILWSKFKDDFQAVKLIYKSIGLPDPIESDLFYIDEDNNLTALTGVEFGTSFKFNSYFKPEDGLDVVEIEPTDDVLSMDTSAASPTNISVIPGLGRMRVQWMVPSNESIVASIVKYQRVADGAGNEVTSESPVYVQYGDNSLFESETYNSNVESYLSTTFSEEDAGAKFFDYTGDILINNRNERYISGDYANPSGDKDDLTGGDYYSNRPATHLAAGYYDVTIYNLKDNSYVSTPSEEDGTMQTIHVYDANTFLRPELTGVPIRDVMGVVTFDFNEKLTWNNATSACSSITIYYAKEGDVYSGVGEGTAITGTIEYFATTGISDAAIGQQFTYSAIFEPSGSFDPISLPATAPDDNSFIPDVAPSSPMSVSTVSGVKEITSDYSGYDTQTPTINVTWTPGADEDGVIEAYRVYWYSSDVSADVYRTEYLELSDIGKNGLTYDSEKGEYYYTISENLDVAKKYSVEVSSATGAIQGLAGRTESERTAVVLKPMTYGYDSYKDLELVYSVVKNNGDAATVMWDNLNEDVVGVSFYYNCAGLTVRYPASGYEPITSAVPYTLLPTAYVGSDFTYIAYYMPYGSDEAVKVKWDATAGTQSGIIPDPVPVPSGLSFETGFSAKYEIPEGETEEVLVGYTANIKVNWNSLVDTEGIVDRMYVRYYGEDGVAVDTRVGLTSTTYSLTELEVGPTYTFQIVTEDMDITDAAGNYLTSESEPAKVKTYSPDLYSSANMPIATATLSEDSSQISIAWSNLDEDLSALYITYNGAYVDHHAATDNADVLGYPEDFVPYTLKDLNIGTTIPVADNGELGFTYHAYFCPEGGEANQIKIEGGRGLAVPNVDSDFELEESTKIFTVNTAVGLEEVATMINASATYRGATIKLAYSIDLSAVCGASLGNWNPIGSQSSPFTGTFDGGGKSINGLYINKTSSATYLGLFGNISGATIKDVTLIAPTITVTNTSAYNTAALVGAASNSTISNCHVKEGMLDVINGTNTSPWSANTPVGAIVGIFSEGGVIESCSNSADFATMTGMGRVGGIVGYVAGANSYIVDCHNSGDLLSSEDPKSLTSRLGGIAGYVNSVENVAIVGCSNAGALRGWSMLGGIVGQFDATGDKSAVVASYSTGNISAADYRIGGVVGSIRDQTANEETRAGYLLTQTGTIIGCFNTGYIFSTYSDGNSSVERGAHIGGILGCDASIAGNTTTVLALDSSATTTDSGETFVTATNMKYYANYFLYAPYAPEGTIVTVVNPVDWAIGGKYAYTNASGREVDALNLDYDGQVAKNVGDVGSGNENLMNLIGTINGELSAFYSNDRGSHIVTKNPDYKLGYKDDGVSDIPVSTKID